MFLKILQYSLENTCVGVFFSKIARLQGCNFIKKKLQHRCFRVKFEKFLRTLILKNICKRLLLTTLSKYGCDNIAQEIYWCNVCPDIEAATAGVL